MENNEVMCILGDLTQLTIESSSLLNQIRYKREELQKICSHSLIDNRETRYENYCFKYKICKTCGKQLTEQ